MAQSLRQVLCFQVGLPNSTQNVSRKRGRVTLPVFHVLYRLAFWRRRVQSVCDNVLRAIKYEVPTGALCGVELHSTGCSVQPLHYFDPLSVIVSAGKDVKARNFHVNLSHFRLWAVSSTTLTTGAVPVKIPLVGLSNTGNWGHIEMMGVTR